MADLSDVLDAFASLITGALYPNGTSNPSVVTAACKVYPGWPQSNILDADVRAGTVNVSIFPRDTERNTTRYPREYVELSRADVTVVATVSTAGRSVTFSGAVAPQQHVSVIVNGKAYSVALSTGETLSQVAAALATLINVDMPASSSGPVLSVPIAYRLKVIIGVDGVQVREIRRVEKQFQVTIWAPTPALRTSVARIVDPLLSALGFLSLADGTHGRITYVRSLEIDETQKEMVYRRDIIWCVEYPTVDTDTATSITILQNDIQGGLPDGAPIVSEVFGHVYGKRNRRWGLDTFDHDAGSFTFDDGDTPSSFDEGA